MPSLPFLDEPSLHLGDHPKHRYNNVAYLTAGRNVGGQDHHQCLPLFNLVDEV